MDALWILLTLGLAGFSAVILCKHLALQWPTNVLNGIVLFFIFHIVPVHLVATLQLFGIIQSISFQLIFALEVLLIVGLWLFLRRLDLAVEVPSKSSSALKRIREFPLYLRATIVVLVVSWLIFLIDLFTSYPKGWDALAYHLPVAVRWLQEGSLNIPSSGDWRFSLPGNAEIGMMLLLGTQCQRLATVFNIIAFAVGAIAVYLIAARVIRKSIPALFATVLFASLPIVQYQAFSGYVDLYGASFVLAGLAIFLCRLDRFYSKTRSTWYLTMILLSGCAWGIAVGTKPTFYVYTAPCFIGASAIIWTEREKHRKSVYYLLTLLTMSILLSSMYWFLRGFYSTGNPIYPSKLEVFGITLLNGMADITPTNYDLNFVRSRLEWLFYPWVEYKRNGYNFSEGSGLGAAWATFVPVAIAYGAYLTLRNIKRKDFLLYSVLMISFFGGSLVWWFFLRRMPRFGIPLLAIACVLAAPLFDLLIKKQLRIFRHLMFSSMILTCILSILIPAHALLGRVRTGSWNRPDIYGYPSLIDQLPKSATVLNLGAADFMNFPLAGKHLSNKVVPSDWLNRNSIYEFIDREHVDFIVGVHPFFSPELSEARARVVFEGKVGDNLWRIWEVKRLPLRESSSMR